MSDETTRADTDPAPPVPQGAVRLTVLGGDPAFSQALRRGGARLDDAEPGPKQASAALLAQFHYGLASARAGALGDVRLIAQLIAAARGEAQPVFWPQPDGTLVDAARPEVDPAGLPDLATATAYRQAHLRALARLLAEAETLVLPLGTPALLADPDGGQVFPRPPAALLPPRLARGPHHHRRDLDAGFARLWAGLQALNPALRLCLIVLPARPARAPRPGRAMRFWPPVPPTGRAARRRCGMIRCSMRWWGGCWPRATTPIPTVWPRSSCGSAAAPICSIWSRAPPPTPIPPMPRPTASAGQRTPSGGPGARQGPRPGARPRK
ncbi:hypothetical protein ACTTAM_10520 [Rhodobacter capsulatus]|uniref:hypothetical protein n=1 Tax=Rhodobacter capsulatus TaxID=1061 RepID=UPI0040258D90